MAMFYRSLQKKWRWVMLVMGLPLQCITRVSDGFALGADNTFRPCFFLESPF